MKQTRSANDKTPLSLFPVKPIWTIPLNSALTTTPAFRDAYAIFPLEGEQLAAYDMESGQRLWIASVTTMFEPAIGAGAVFLAADDSLIALSLRTGERVWTQPFDDELAAPPLVAGDRLVITTANGEIVALRTSDGGEIWRRALPRSASSRPAYNSNRLFVPTADNDVAALNLQTGDVIWRRRLGGTGHDILATEDRIFLGAQDRFFYCLNTKNGEVEWRWATGADAIGLPVADEKTVYFVSLDNILRAMNRSSGVQRWKSALALRPIAGPLKYRETLVVAGTTPVLQAFSTREGKTLGRYAAPAELSASPYLFTDRARVFPVLVTISSDIVGNATVTATTRDMEPASAPLTPLPNEEKLPEVPAAPSVLDEVSALPNLTPVVAPNEQ